MTVSRPGSAKGVSSSGVRGAGNGGNHGIRDDDENVKVVVRVRPMNDKEMSADYRNIVTVDSIHGSVRLDQLNSTSSRETPPKVFHFDTVFAANCSQLDVYNRVARPIVDNVLEGYNGTIFAYGQTGTGKTFTMEGDRSVAELKGIIPNSFAHIFGHIAKAEGNLSFLVRVSYLEIYNEEVRDLLGKDQNLRLEVKERPDVGVYVKDLSVFMVNNADDMDKLMTMGNRNRSIGATNMNALSSRSHAIFTITVECSETGADRQQHFRVGKLHLVDLAGSERQAKTGATGQRLKEATKINLSLSTLGNVISALVDGKSSHIPYRNSKLTRLLQDSLGGNSKTLMFANIGPAEYNYDETLSTLRYASRAKNIKNHAKVNQDPKDALMKKYQEEIEELKRLLAQQDQNSGGDGSNSSSGLESGSESDGDAEAGEGAGAETGEIPAEVSASAKPKPHPHKKIGLEEMRQRVEGERKRLKEEKDMAEGEKHQVEEQLKKHEEELASAQAEHDLYRKKLAALEKKIIVGGENLLEKAEEQERLLEESAKQLEETIQREADLRKALKEREAERLDVEEKYSSLQEEAAGKTRKLKKVWTMLTSAKAELADLQAEQQREMEGMLDNVRQLTRDLKLQMLVIDAFIPPDYQAIIEDNVQWNEEIGEWQLKCVAYTGNNMRKKSDEDHVPKSRGHSRSTANGSAHRLEDFSLTCDGADTSSVFMLYQGESTGGYLGSSKGPSSVLASGRPKTARSKNGGRSGHRPKSKR